MGGTGFVIRGTREGGSVPAAGSFWWKRLAGALAGASGDDAGPAELARDFRGWLERKLVPPRPATRVFLDYLDVAAPSVYLRRDGRDGGDTAELAFSSCAGMADTSADLAYHWACAWWRERGAAVTAEVLLPAGFRPDGRTNDDDDGTRFLPLGSAGHAAYQPDAGEEEDAGEDEDDAGPTGPRHFEIDASASEGLSESDRKAFAAIDARLVKLMADGRCRCQVCMPGFDPATVGAHPFAE